MAESRKRLEGEVTWTRMVGVLLASRLRSQLAYRGSMAAETLTQGVLVVAEFAELWVLLHHSRILGGLGLAETALIYACAAVAFGLADLVCGSLDTMDSWVRDGRLEVLLVRPTSLMTQMITQDLQLRRVGRVVAGVVAYPALLLSIEIEWTWWKVVLAVVAPLAGALIFASSQVAAGGFLMVVIGARQAVNAIAYGAKYAGSVPGAALFTPVRIFFTFVAPALLTAWLPMALVLGSDTPAWTPAWLGWLGLPVGLVTMALALWAWRGGIRHYTGAGG